jgi:hypothetical protein
LVVAILLLGGASTLGLGYLLDIKLARQIGVGLLIRR